MQRNPIGYSITQYLSKFALPLGGWFILEFLVRNYSAHYMMLGFVLLPMMLVTPVALFLLIRKLRNDIMPDGALSGIQAWTFCLQLMFFAGLLEALFIWVFNGFLFPDNLHAIHEAMLQQYHSTSELASASGLDTGFLGEILSESADVLQEQPIPTPIESAMSALSTTLFTGLLLGIPVALWTRKK